MKKEVQYLAVLAVLALGVAALYYGGTSLTGFAVFDQSSQDDFNGTYENVFYNSNLSAIIVNTNQTNGTYTSQIFDAGNESSWNNLTFVGNDLTFEVRSCEDSGCSNESFSNASLGNLNLTGQYFQYEVTFNSNVSNLTSVSLDYSIVEEIDSTPLEIEIVKPVEGEEYFSNKNVPLEFGVEGNEGNLTCWYVLDGSNHTLGSCGNYSGNLGDDVGSYDLFVYVVDASTNETVSDSVSFSVVSPPKDDEDDDESSSETSTKTTTTKKTNEDSLYTAEFSSEDFLPLTLSPGSSQDVSWIVNNTGNGPSSACGFSSEGDYSSWILYFGEERNINARDGSEFLFTVSPPLDAEAGEYGLGVSVKCDQLTFSKELVVNVETSEQGIQEESDNEASRSGFTGLAIFGDEGIGTGGYVVLILSVLGLTSVIFVSRRMRKDGKTLKDVFDSVKKINFKFWEKEGSLK